MDEVEERGGAVAAIESGFIQQRIADSAYDWELGLLSGDRVVVGVNKYQASEEVGVPILRIDENAVRRQIERVGAYRERQDRQIVEESLLAVEQAAQGTDNLLVVMKAALLHGATLGEICGRLRSTWGEYRPTA
jgi:methylmalonyl-CoA mutase N-terminal domain/subunit